jgi:hypothetical protein
MSILGKRFWGLAIAWKFQKLPRLDLLVRIVIGLEVRQLAFLVEILVYQNPILDVFWQVDPSVLLGVLQGILLNAFLDDLTFVFNQTDICIKGHIKLIGVDQLLVAPLLVTKLSCDLREKLFHTRTVGVAREQSSV